MAYASETWTGTTGASWGSNWTAVFGNGTATIQGNAGQITAGTNSYELMHFSGMPAVGDTEVVVTVVPNSVANTYTGVGILGDGATNANAGYGYSEQNGIAAYVNWNGTGSNIWISQTVAGTETVTTHIALSFTPTAGTAYQVRVKRSGLNIYARCWPQSSSEPTTWNVTTTTVSGTPVSGKVFLQTGTDTSTFDNLQAHFGWINETWTGTTGANWPSAWTIRGTNGNPGPTLATIQSNAGQLAPGANAYSGVRGSLETVTMTAASAIVSATFNVADQYIQLNLNGSGTGSGYNGYYHTPIGIGVELGGGGGLNIYEVPSDGNGSTIGSGSVGALTLNVPYKIRLMTTDGQNYSAKVWAASASEPAAWTITGKASKVYSGFPGVGAQNGNNTNITALLDDFYVIDSSAPGLTLPYTETWTGTTGAAWPSYWTTPIGGSNGGGTSSIQANAGQLVSGATAYMYAERTLAAMPSIGDTDATVQITGSVTSVEQYAALWINSDPFIINSNGSSTNAINITLNYNSGVVQLYQGATQVGTNVTKTLTATTAYLAHIRRFSGTVYARVWAAASPEPTTWDFSIPLSSFPNTTPVSGVVELESQAGAVATARTFTFANMTVTVPLAMETWTGTTGAAWPSQWGAVIGNTANGAAAMIQSNAGQITSGTGGSYAGARSVLTGLNVSQILDVTGTVVMGASGVEQGWDVSLADDVTGGGVSPLNGYTLYGYYTAAATTSYLQLLGFSGGVRTVLASTANRTLTGTTPYSFRYQLINGVLQARVWAASAAEPTTWDITYTISGTPLTGKVSLGVNQGSASGNITATYSNLLVNGILIAAPTASFTATPLSGNVPLVVNFTDTSTGGATTWSWDFGDGTTSTVQNAYHYYLYPGEFTVALTASNGTGSTTFTQSNLVTAGISVVQQVTANTGTSRTVSPTISIASVVAGHGLTLSVNGAFSSTLTVSDTAGNTWVNAAELNDNNYGGGDQAIFYVASGVASASNTITLTSTLAADFAISLVEWSRGIVLNTGATSTAGVNGQTSATMMSTSSVGDLVIAAINTSNQLAYAPTLPAIALTTSADTSLNTPIDRSAYVIATGSSASIVWDFGGATVNWEGVIASFHISTAPTLTLPYTETWTGTTGAAWPSVWSTVQSSGSGGSATIQSNAGRLSSGSNSSSYMKAYLASMPSITDTDIITSFTVGTQSTTNFNLHINADNTQYSGNPGEMPQNGYTLNFSVNATAASSTYDMWKVVNGSLTQLYATTNTTITAATKYNVRFQRTGTYIRFRMWVASGSEPASWTASYSDTATMVSPGKAALAMASAVSQTIDFDDLTVTSLMGSIKVQGASALMYKPIKVWNGDTWAPKPLKTWTGSAWRIIGSNIVPYPFTDDFSTALNTTTKWMAANTTAGATTVNGRLRVTCDSTYEQAGSNFQFDLSQYPVYVQIPTIPAPGNGSTQTQFVLQGQNGSAVSFQLQSNPTTISMNVTNGPQTNVTYNASNHVWFRFRIDIGFLLWETSPDKVAWTTIRTYGVPSWMMQGNPVAVILSSGYYGTETSPGYAEFDNFNL